MRSALSADQLAFKFSDGVQTQDIFMDLAGS